MKQLWRFVKKEFYHIFRDTRTILIIIGIPIAQILLIGFAVSTEVKNVQVAVYDTSNDVSTQQIIDKLGASEYFTIVRNLNYPEEIDEVFKEGKINFVIVFAEDAIQLITDATEPNQATTITAYASNVIMDYQQELLVQQQIPFQIIPEVKMLYNPEMRSAYNFVPGLLGLIFMLICAMMTSIAIVREKETGTMEVLLASPMKPIYVVIAKMLPYFIISWFIFILILVLSVSLLKVPIAGSLIWLNIFSLLFIVVALALGLLISTIVNTQVAAMLVSGMVFMLPIMLLSGMIFPIESMPAILQTLSTVIPARWYIAGVRKLMIEGVSVIYVWKEFTILLGMAILIITVSLKKLKVRLE
jgi:ABC-2 type transport system permease protein